MEATTAPGGGRKPWLILAVVVGLVAVGVQGYYWAAFGRKWTDSDQTLLWLTARDLSHGQVHQFNFYGQTYGTAWETIPAAVLMRLGMSPASAVPLSTTTLATFAVLLLALPAIRRGRWFIALCCLLILPLATPNYTVLLDAPRGIMAGLFLGSLATSLWLLWPDSTKARAFLFAGGPLAILFDLGTALLVIPVLLVALVQTWQSRRPAAYLALVAPILYALVLQWHYGRHPEQNRYDPTPFAPKPHLLLTSLRHLPDYFRVFALGPVPGVWVIFLSLLLLAYHVARSRSQQGALALASVVLVLLAMFSSPKSQDAVGGLYLAPDRLFLALPMALIVVALLTGPSPAPGYLVHRHPRLLAATAVALVLVLAVGGVARAVIRLPAFTRANTRASVSTFILQVRKSASVKESCAAIAAWIPASGAQITAFADASEPAYACPALRPGMKTLDLPYERRSWVIDTLQRPAQRILVAGAWSGCPHGGPSRVGCRAMTPVGPWLLSGPGESVNGMLHAVGLAVLPFTASVLPANCMQRHDC